jgi:RHS repeat-associated protein
VLAQHDGNYNGDLYFYLHDRLGSVRQVVDMDADVANRYTYGPFGNIFAAETTETAENAFTFTGQWYDEEIGQYYLRARMYDPQIYRFTARDPVTGRFTEPLSLHPYLYCLNDPLNRIDPTGEFALLDLLLSSKISKSLRGAVTGVSMRAWALAVRVYAATFVRAVKITMFIHGISAGGSRVPTLTGYTRHGINSAISHDGVGVSPQAILNATSNPLQVIKQADGTFKFIGENAIVILNEFGEVITMWATSSKGWR